MAVPADRRCTAKSRSGERCKKAAIKGGKVCATHGGRARQVKAKAAERVEKVAVEKEALRLGIVVEVDPGEALLGALYRAWADLHYYDDRVNQHQAAGGEVYGRTYHASGYETGEAKRHILVQMREDATKRVAEISALALRAGVEERRVRLAEADARGLATEVIGALADIRAPKELAERFKAALAARLRALPAAS